jgi:hypothetical protein
MSYRKQAGLSLSLMVMKATEFCSEKVPFLNYRYLPGKLPQFHLIGIVS